MHLLLRDEGRRGRPRDGVFNQGLDRMDDLLDRAVFLLRYCREYRAGADLDLRDSGRRGILLPGYGGFFGLRAGIPDNRGPAPVAEGGLRGNAAAAPVAE